MDENTIKEVIREETEPLRRAVQYLANFVQYPNGKNERETIDRICNGDFSDFE